MRLAIDAWKSSYAPSAAPTAAIAKGWLDAATIGRR